MTSSDPAAFAKLWFLFLQEQFEAARAQLPTSAKGVIAFRTRAELLGVISLAGRHSAVLATNPPPDCIVSVDETRIASLFSAEGTQPSTFTVSGNGDLFEALLTAIENKPRRMSWLEARKNP